MKNLEQLQEQKKFDIINKWGQSGLVEHNIREFRLSDENKADLAQMVYVYLLEMSVESFFDLVDRNKMASYIRRIAVIQYKSSTSKFYKDIIKFKITTSNIEDYADSL